MEVPDRLALDSDEVDLVLGRLSRRSFLADVTSFCTDHGVECRVEERRRRLLSVEVRVHLAGPHDRLADVARYVRAMKAEYNHRSAGGFDGFSGGDGGF
jgi:hypothetical protein